MFKYIFSAIHKIKKFIGMLFINSPYKVIASLFVLIIIRFSVSILLKICVGLHILFALLL